MIDFFELSAMKSAQQLCTVQREEVVTHFLRIETTKTDKWFGLIFLRGARTLPRIARTVGIRRLLRIIFMSARRRMRWRAVCAMRSIGTAEEGLMSHHVENCGFDCDDYR